MKVKLNFKYMGAISVFLFGINSHTSEFQLGVGETQENFSYIETLPEPSKSTETTTIQIPMLNIRYLFTNDNWMQFQISNASNLYSNYVGSDLYSNAPITAKNTLGFFNYELKYYFPISSSIKLHIGYGVRTWNRFLAGTPGYREIYSWNYGDLGIDFNIYHNPRFQFNMELSSKPTTSGKIKIITSDTFTNGEDSEIALGSKNGYRISLPSQIILSTFAGIDLIPYYEHSEIGESVVVTNRTLAPTPGTGIKEPSSNTIRTGIELILFLRY